MILLLLFFCYCCLAFVIAVIVFFFCWCLVVFAVIANLFLWCCYSCCCYYCCCYCFCSCCCWAEKLIVCFLLEIDEETYEVPSDSSGGGKYYTTLKKKIFGRSEFSKRLKEFSQTLPTLSRGYECTENMFYFFYKLLFSILTKRKTIYIKRTCVVFFSWNCKFS